MSTPNRPAKLPWDTRVQQILSSVRRRGTMLMTLGYVVYGGGTAAMLIFIPDKSLATVLVMFFFQLLVLYFGTREMYPAIQGAFRTALEANRDSVPLFEKLADGVDKIQNDPANHPLVQEIKATIEKTVVPTVQRWERIGERIEKVTLPQFEQLTASLSERAQKIDAKVSSGVEGVKRVTQQIEMELASGMLTELRQAADMVKTLGMQYATPTLPPVPPAAATSPRPQPGRPVQPAQGRQYGDILASLGKKPNGAPASVQGGKA